MEQTYLQQQTHQRLQLIRDRTDAIARYVERCGRLVDRGLAADTSGVPSCDVIAQYGELIAVTGTQITAQANALVKQLRGLK